MSVKISKIIYLNSFIKKKENIIIVYVDDGSTDNTTKKLNFLKNQLSNNITLKIITHKKNLGLGEALKSGFNYSFSVAKDDDVLITMDTDNSHTIEQSYELFKKIIFDNADISIASRYLANSKIRGLKNTRVVLSYFAAKLFKFFFRIKNVKDYMWFSHIE